MKVAASTTPSHAASSTCQWKRPELGAVVGLDALDAEGQLLEDVVEELGRPSGRSSRPAAPVDACSHRSI
jgi:hypothetical protein